MKIALVQCYDEENFSQYFITEHIRLFYMALCDLGCDVIVLTNHYDPSRFNIFFSVMNATPEFIASFLKEKINYAVYQPEILMSQGVNVRPERLPTDPDERKVDMQEALNGLYVYLKILANARLVLEVFPFNQKYLSMYKIKSILFPIGYHEALENPPEQEKSFDLCFFGALSSHRQRILNQLIEHGFKFQLINKRHNFFRDNILTRTKINIALPYNTDTMDHISPFRVYTALYNGCMTLSVSCKKTPSVEGMLEYIPENMLIERIEQLIATQSYQAQYTNFKTALKKRPMTKIMRQMLGQISSTIKHNRYAGPAFAQASFDSFEALPSPHIVFNPTSFN